MSNPETMTTHTKRYLKNRRSGEYTGYIKISFNDNASYLIQSGIVRQSENDAQKDAEWLLSEYNPDHPYPFRPEGHKIPHQFDGV